MSDKSNENIIDTATEIYFSDNISSLLEYISPHKNDYPIKESEENIKFNHLLAFAYIFQNKFPEAEKHCHDCICVEQTPLDYYFVLTYLHKSMREYDKVLKFSELFLSLYDSVDSTELNFSFTSNHKCQIFHFVGLAYLELGDKEKAIYNFTEAIKTDKENHLPYLSLVNLYNNFKEYDLANNIILEGMKECRQIQELRLLEKSINSENKNQSDATNRSSEKFNDIIQLADSYKNEANYENAVQRYESVLHTQPHNISVLYSLSECYLLMGQKDMAIIGFRRILSLNPYFKPAQEQINSLTEPVIGG